MTRDQDDVVEEGPEQVLLDGARRLPGEAAGARRRAACSRACLR